MSTTIRTIASEEFHQIAPNLTEFGFPDKEMDWYANPKGDVIGKLILDKIERTWLGYVWIRDNAGTFAKGKKDQYGHDALAGQPYQVEMESEARQLLTEKMEELLSGRIEGQSTEK